ncbi:MAG: hypothetical protein C0501_23060 [Isosphaera sp.]|nr:hypothetical protein [Isosphaera sp.]
MDPTPPRPGRTVLLMVAVAVAAGAVAGSALTWAVVRPDRPAPAAGAPPEMARPEPPPAAEVAPAPREVKPALRVVEPTAGEIAAAAGLHFARTYEFSRPAVWCLIREHNHPDADKPVYSSSGRRILYPGERLTIVGRHVPVRSLGGDHYRVTVRGGREGGGSFFDPKELLGLTDSASWSVSGAIEGKAGEAYTLCQFGWSSGNVDFNMSLDTSDRTFWPLVDYRRPYYSRRGGGGVAVRWSLRVLFVESKSNGDPQWGGDSVYRFLDAENLIRDTREPFLRQKLERMVKETGTDTPFVHDANNIAWLLATAPFPSLRDGRRAVAYAIRACELNRWSSIEFLETLAAAHAEAGEFDKAVEWQQKVLDSPHFDKVFTPREQANARERHLLYLGRKPLRMP